jgi:polar amino acid transport system substrate-binding protein
MSEARVDRVGAVDRRQALRLLGGGAGLLAVGGLPRSVHGSGMTLKDIKESGKLRVGVEATFVPFTFRKDGKVVGYDPDLAEIMSEELGVKPEIIDTAWAGIIPALYTKKFDIIMTSMAYTAERMQRVAFSIPYAEVSLQLLIRAADAATIKSPEDLVGKIVASKLGSPTDTLARKLNDQVKATKGTGFGEIKVFNDDPARYLALAQGKVDAVIQSIASLASVLRDQPGKFAVVKGIGADNWAGIATRKEDVELVEFLNAQIRKLKANETLYRLQDKWFGFRMELPDKLPVF